MRILILLTFWIFMDSLSAQFTHVLPMKPAVGTTMSYQVDNLPERIQLGTPGDDNIWNFSSLQSAMSYQYVYADGPDGQIVLRDPWQNESIIENGRITGITLRDKASGYVYKNYTDPVNNIWSGQKNHNAKDNARWTTELDKPYLIAKGEKDYDKLRIVVSEEVTVDADASGFLYLPRSMHDAERVHVRVLRAIEVEAEQDGAWVEIPNTIVAEIGLDIPTITEYYAFFDPNDELLAQVMLNELGAVGSVIYTADESTSGRIFDTTAEQEFVLYPSTSFGDVRLDFIGFSPGGYTMEVYNILRKKMWSKSYRINGSQTIKEDLSFLPKGTYIYTLYDDRKQRILSRRLAIIKR